MRRALRSPSSTRGTSQRTEDVNLSQSAGEAEETVALATSEDNAIFVQRYALNRSVSAGDAEVVRKELDQVLSQLAGAPLEGERIDTGGPLTFRYEVTMLETPEDGRSTIVVTFDGDTEYFINCQSVPDGREELEQACDQAIETLQVKNVRSLTALVETHLSRRLDLEAPPPPRDAGAVRQAHGGPPEARAAP